MTPDIGALIGAMTVDECARVHDIATAIGTTLAFIYDDDGNPVLVDIREVAA